MSFSILNRLLPSFGRYNRVLEDGFWRGRHFILRPSELFFFSETSHYFYDGRIEALKTQRKTPSGRRTVHLMGITHFLQRLHRLQINLTLVKDDHSWLLERNRNNLADGIVDEAGGSRKSDLKVDQVIASANKDNVRSYLAAHVVFSEEDVQAGLDLLQLAGHSLLETSGNPLKLIAQLTTQDAMSMAFTQSSDPFHFACPVVGFFEGSLSSPFYFRSIEEMSEAENLTPEQLAEVVFLVRHILPIYRSPVQLQTLAGLLRGPRKASGSIYLAFKDAYPKLDFAWTDRLRKGYLDPAPVEYTTLARPTDRSVADIKTWLKQRVPDIDESAQAYIVHGFKRLGDAYLDTKIRNFPKLNPESGEQLPPVKRWAPQKPEAQTRDRSRSQKEDHKSGINHEKLEDK